MEEIQDTVLNIRNNMTSDVSLCRTISFYTRVRKYSCCVTAFRYCETTENECEVIKDACVSTGQCRKRVNTYTCDNGHYQDTNPYNCTLTRENCKFVILHDNLCSIVGNK